MYIQRQPLIDTELELDLAKDPKVPFCWNIKMSALRKLCTLKQTHSMAT